VTVGESLGLEALDRKENMSTIKLVYTFLINFSEVISQKLGNFGSFQICAEVPV